MKSFNLLKINRGAEIKLFRAAFLTLLCVFFLSSGAFPQAKKPAAKKPAAPKKAPVNLPKITQIDDAKIRELLKANGKPLLVNFWATWCVPCREEFPDLVKIDGEYRGKIDFITISLDFIEDIDTLVPEFLSEMKAEMPTYLLLSEDESALISSITKDWNGGLPFTVLYNPKGELVYFHQGIVKPEILRAEIEKTFNNQNKSSSFERGKSDALKDTADGKLIFKSVFSHRLDYLKTFEEKYGIIIESLATFNPQVFKYFVNNEAIEYAIGYNSISEIEIKKNFGEEVSKLIVARFSTNFPADVIKLTVTKN